MSSPHRATPVPPRAPAPVDVAGRAASEVPAPAADAVLTKAVVRAAGLLEFTQRELAGIIGVSAASASRLCAGNYRLTPDRPKEWELARLFVRAFRSLDALWGHGDAARTWLSSHNLALAARPRDLLTSVEGLVRVVGYLDAARGRL